MGIVRAVWKNENDCEIALVTDIGVIPFVDEGDHFTQDLIDGFEEGSHALDSRWSILDESEKSEFVNASDQFWLDR